MTGSAKKTWDYTDRQRSNAQLTEFAIRAGNGVAVQRPVRVYLQLASACNLSCYMCSEYNRPPEARHGVGLVSMSPELIGKLEKAVLPFSSHVILGVGGEPTFSSHFVETVKRLREANQRITLITNGTFFERDAVARAVAENVSEVQLSVDAATRETYERIRIGSRWSRILGGVKNLQRFRSGSTLQSTLQLNFVLMRSNVHELAAVVDLAAAFGAGSVFAQHVHAMTKPSQQEPLLDDPGLYDTARLAAIERATLHGIELRIPNAFGSDVVSHSSISTDEAIDTYAVPCREPQQAIVVLYDGRVFACCHPLAHAKMLLGNLNEQSFESIWNGPLYRNLRIGMRCGDVPTICKECPMVHSPPPAAVDAAYIEASETLEAHYSGRELSGTLPFAAAHDYATELRTHATALERARSDAQQHIAALSERNRELEADLFDSHLSPTKPLGSGD